MIELFQKIKNNKKLYATRIYLTALGIYMFTLVIAESAYVTRHEAGKLGLILKAIQLLATALCCVRLFIDPPCCRVKNGGRKIDVKCTVILTGGLLICLFCAYNSGYMQSLLVPFFMLGAIDIDSKAVIKTAIAIESSILGVLLILSQLGLAEDYVFGDSSTRLRHSLGTNWCTVTAISFFFIMLGYIYIKEGKLCWYEAVVFEAIHLYLYFMTRTRMTFMLSSVAVGFFYIQGLWKHPWKVLAKLKFIWIACPIVAVIASVIASIMYSPNNVLWMKLNDLFSNRFELSQRAFSSYSITLFGQKIEWNGYYILNPESTSDKPYNYVDCSYLQIMFSYGIIFLAILIAIHSVAIYQFIKTKRVWGAVIVLLVVAHSLTEPHLFNVKINPIILVLIPIICEKSGDCITRRDKKSCIED